MWAGESVGVEGQVMNVLQTNKESGAGTLPVAPGRFDSIEYSEQFLTVAGWMFSPGRALDTFRLKVNGAQIGEEVVPEAREGVQKKFGVPEALNSGFRMRAVAPEKTFRNWAEVEVCGRVGGQDIGQISMLYRPDYQAALVEAPAELRFRVTGSRNSIGVYWLAGLQTFGKFYRAITRYGGPDPVNRLLDWGCGCGRVTGVLLKYLTGVEVHGCDIDREAVEWCAANFPTGHFTAVAPHPPTTYADNTFNVVTGCSVLTHLRRELQFDWLKEMNRIIAPGGLLLVSVHGDFAAASFNNRPEVKTEVETVGISDRTPDHILDGIAPDSYYRGTFQSKAYTCQEFARYFEVIDYIELGMGNLQDLVVMKKA
jgi:SAM-dependent methyltransferase